MMSYDYDRRTATELSRPDAKGDPTKEALSNGWDAKEDFTRSAHQVLMDLEIDPSYYEDARAREHAKGLSRLLNTLDKQSRPWQTSYNNWLNDKPTDFHKLSQGLAETVALIHQIVKMLPTENWKTAGAVKEANEAVAHFEQAMKGLLHLHAQGASQEEEVRKSHLTLGPGVVNEHNTRVIRERPLKAINQGDIESAVISAAFYAKKQNKTMYVYRGNDARGGWGLIRVVFRVSPDPKEFLSRGNNMGDKVISVTPDLTVSDHDVH
jgi:hypothetical protein